MGLCVVNGLAVGAVHGGHVVASCNVELMLKVWTEIWNFRFDDDQYDLTSVFLLW